MARLKTTFSYVLHFRRMYNGSEIDIIRQDLAHRAHLPIHEWHRLFMKDANVGRSELRAVARPVELQYGQIRTHSNIYLNQFSPF